MTARASIMTAAALAALLSGCATTDHSLRYQGVTRGAGNAIAANTVMQMVDPWPAGVEDTDLAVPADHDQYLPQEREGGEAGGAVTTGGN
jgi:hypothetical protein